MQEATEISLPSLRTPALPACITAAGAAAGFAWEEFFLGQVRNPHTRTAYLRAVKRFLAWTESQGLELLRITPGMVGHYFNELPLSIPSKKLHLAALRAFFDNLVQRHVLILNPAHSVRTERYSQVEGATPEITVVQARNLLKSIELHSIIDLRDRAIIAVLIYTAARAGAVAKLRLRDFAPKRGFTLSALQRKAGRRGSFPAGMTCNSSWMIISSRVALKATGPIRRYFARSARMAA